MLQLAVRVVVVVVASVVVLVCDNHFAIDDYIGHEGAILEWWKHSHNAIPIPVAIVWYSYWVPIHAKSYHNVSQYSLRINSSS